MNYPTYPVEIDRVDYQDYKNVGLYLTRFVEDNIPVLFIGEESNQEMITICNLNPSDSYQLNDFEFAIKNYSENEGMVDWLLSHGFIEIPYTSYPGGFVDVPVCYASEKLKQKIIKACEISNIF